MKSKQHNKTLGARTGKDLLHLLDSKEKLSGEMDAPLFTGEVEIALSNIWKAILGHERFTLNDDFFWSGEAA